MATLKTLRENLNLNQSQVAQKLNITVPQYSNYETGTIVPPLEDAILLEKNFNQRVEWADSLDARQKVIIMNCLTKLSRNYPLASVLNFAVKYLKEGIRVGTPEKFILFYTMKSEQGEDALLPPNIKFNRTK